jgi:hypothetical protein
LSRQGLSGRQVVVFSQNVILFYKLQAKCFLTHFVSSAWVSLVLIIGMRTAASVTMQCSLLLGGTPPPPHIIMIIVLMRVNHFIYTIYIHSLTNSLLLTETALGSVRVRITLHLTVSQSVCLGVEPNLGLLTRDIFFFFKPLSCHLGAPSLTRGRVCHLSVFCQYSLK